MAGRGRPKKAETNPITVRMTDEFLLQIDEARKRQPDLPSRPEMIRRMLEDWLRRDLDAKSD